VIARGILTEIPMATTQIAKIPAPIQNALREGATATAIDLSMSKYSPSEITRPMAGKRSGARPAPAGVDAITDASVATQQNAYVTNPNREKNEPILGFLPKSKSEAATANKQPITN